MEAAIECDIPRRRSPLSFEPLLDGIVRQLRSAPDHCAIRFRDVGITNATLLDKVLRLADAFAGAGVDHGTRVGVCLERGPEVLVILLALWLRGAVYVPLDLALPRERLFTMCGTAELELLVAQPLLRESVSSLPCPLLVLEPMSFTALREDTPLPVTAPATVFADDTAYILFTSGSSGTPKGVMISHGNIAALFEATLPLLALSRGCRIFGCANFSFDISFFELLAPLLCRGTLVLADKESCSFPERLLHLIEREQVTVLQATPSHWQLLNALPWSSTLDVALATGEALPRTTAVAIREHAKTLWNLYGPTECTVWASAHRVTEHDLSADAASTVSIGRALPGSMLWLESNPATDTDKVGDVGELLIGGAGVGLGYCGEADATSAFHADAASAMQRVYRTGDLCRRDESGLLHYLGRRDNQVKHNGYRIELDEIAHLLQQHMSISQAACLVKPATASANSLLFACVVFRPGMPNRDKAKLNTYLASHLPAWMLPQRYFFVERLPLTANGKLDRAALLALTEPVKRTTETTLSLESRIAQVFCEVLDIDSIGPHDSFLDVGGSSMLAATLVLTLNERVGCSLTLRQALSTPPTVSRIMQLLDPASG